MFKIWAEVCFAQLNIRTGPPATITSSQKGLAQVLAQLKWRKTNLLFMSCELIPDSVSCLYYLRLQLVWSIKKKQLKYFKSLTVILMWQILLHLAVGRKSSECLKSKILPVLPHASHNFDDCTIHVSEITTRNVSTSGSTSFLMALQ